ncbi:hypothetical protein DY000_02037344 [Brassica cretica]|uniref:DUF3741 domain-containing protein n=1 Tax=Brassica cretica TaxID=69181 RepID=A0ABQ7B869_BRACR|nr:hypothetical protein DY000_02037344 [Brassica cretica]
MSSQSGLDKIKHQQEEMDTDTQAEIQDHTRRTLLCDPDAGHSQPTLSGKVPSGSQLGQTAQVQDSSSKLPQAPSDSVPRLSDLKAMQNSDSGHIRSMFFKKIEKPQSHVLESPTQTEIRLVTHERIGSNLNPTIDKRLDTKDALAGSKTRTAPTELSKTDSETENVNTNSSSHEKIIQKDHSGTRTVENVAGLMDGLQLLAKKTTREKSTIQGNISSSNPDASSLTEKLNKHLSSGGESLQKSKMVSLERPKLGNIMSDLRAATQRAIGVNNDQPNSAVQPQVNPSTRNERNTEAPIRKSSEIHHLAPRDRTQALQYRNVGVKKDQTSSAMQPEVSSSARNETNTEAPVRKSSEIHHLAPRDKTQVLQYRTIGGKKDQHSSALQPEARSSISKDRNTEAPVNKISEIHHLAPRDKTQILHCPPSLKRKALNQSSEIHHLAPRDKTQVLQYRTIGGKKDQHSSALQPEARSSISKDRNTEAPVNKISEIHHLAPRDKTQILHCPPSLKRKALNQDADRSLMPQLKRFSVSPRETRNVKELTHTVGQVKVSSQASRLDNNTTKQLVKESPRAKPQPQFMNMANLEIPITEYDENIEKAESYTKELDNICNILKKKHEEAKELLVRAVVNNNKLLMLNHPLHEDKISFY